MKPADLVEKIGVLSDSLKELSGATVEGIEDAKVAKEVVKQQKAADGLAFDLKQLKESVEGVSVPAGRAVGGESLANTSSRFASSVKVTEGFATKVLNL